MRAGMGAHAFSGYPKRGSAILRVPLRFVAPLRRCTAKHHRMASYKRRPSWLHVSYAAMVLFFSKQSIKRSSETETITPPIPFPIVGI